MNENAIYPATLDADTPVTPEIRDLWTQAWRKQRSRRNLALLWQIPLAVVLPFVLLVAIVSAYHFHPILGVVIGAVVFVIPPFIAAAVGHTFEYSVSDDQSSAKIEFRRTWKSIPSVVTDAHKEHTEGAGESFGGCVMAIAAVLTFAICLPAFTLISLPGLVSQFVWLSDYRELMNRYLSESEEPAKTIVRGTNVLPSIVAAGSAPGDSSDTRAVSNDPILEVLGGRLQLHPDGSVAAEGGVKFEPDSTFENVEINGIKLTRADVGLLRVHHEGEEHAFFFNGSGWSEV